LPRVHFLLLGSVCRAVEEWERPANIGLAGVVSDVEKSCWLDICDVGLNPVISGSGTNLKLIEYAAAGVPVVSTEFGARGIGFSAGREYVSATAEAFANGIETLLGQAHGERESMARHARRLIEANSDWSSIAGTYATALKDLLA
jgi:glycosyltransferase involved in cell wall biosynthesis